MEGASGKHLLTGMSKVFPVLFNSPRTPSWSHQPTASEPHKTPACSGTSHKSVFVKLLKQIQCKSKSPIVRTVKLRSILDDYPKCTRLCWSYIYFNIWFIDLLCSPFNIHPLYVSGNLETGCLRFFSWQGFVFFYDIIKKKKYYLHMYNGIFSILSEIHRHTGSNQVKH